MYTYHGQGTQKAVRMWWVWSFLHKLSDSKAHIHVLSDHLQSSLWLIANTLRLIIFIHRSRKFFHVMVVCVKGEGMVGASMEFQPLH